jgi:rhodanese-related sulfurtransferase
MNMNSALIVCALVLFAFGCKDIKETEGIVETEKVAEVKATQQQKTVLLSPNDFQNQIIKATEIQLIDVRTLEEFSEGHIASAKNINIKSNEFSAQIETLDKTKAVYLYCRSGGRSGQAADILTEMGFTLIYDLEGGITAWMDEDLPTVK